MVAAKDWRVHHLDVKSTFLNGELAEMVFVRQPPDFVVKGAEHRVLRLHKAPYGLRQASCAWNAKLDATLGELGFQWCAIEHVVYTQRRGKEELVDPPSRCRPIGLKWVCKVKWDEHGAIVKHKARLVARDFVQHKGIDF